MGSRPVAPVPPKTAMRIASSSSSDDGSGGAIRPELWPCGARTPRLHPTGHPAPRLLVDICASFAPISTKSRQRWPAWGRRRPTATRRDGCLRVSVPRSGQRPRRRPLDDRIDSSTPPVRRPPAGAATAFRVAVLAVLAEPCEEEELVVYRTPPADAGALAAPRPRPPPNDDAPERDAPEPEPEPEPEPPPREAPEPEPEPAPRDAPEPEPPPREAPKPDPAPRGAPEPDRPPRPPPPDDGRPPPAASSAMAVGVTCAATSPTSCTNAGEPARTAWGVAVILARRVNARKSPACSGSTRVTTSPPDPARAVRPERCRYALS